jgi:inosine/xanthosine triphosphate pyrophosphatase family protein
MAEAGEDLKNSISHRADALKKLLPFLQAYYKI